jgi:small subunit ribosomal protein S4
LARYCDAVCKLCRREGDKLFLKGERCSTPKCAFERRSYPAGAHGKRSQFRRKESDYALQLRAKQKARRVYGVFERQFRRYFERAQRQSGLTGVNLLIMLETRLDNVVYRLGFADSRPQARQLVQHGHIDVNGSKVNVPSFLVRANDTVSLRERSRRSLSFKDLPEQLDGARVPAWLSLDAPNLAGKVVTAPSRDDVDVTLSEQLIVEYYSR